MNFLKRAISVSGSIANQSIRTFQQSTRLASTPAGIAERKFVPLTNIKPIKADNLFQHLESLKPEKYPGEEKLIRLHTHPSIKQTKKKAHLLNGQPIAKGVVLRTLVKKPRKPNSANRKCVLLRMSFGKEMTAYVPGEGHNLQEHNVVLCKIGRLRDTPGVKLKCIRGAYDLPHVAKKRQD